MQMNEDPLNRRDAKSAETDESRPLEEMSRNDDCSERPASRSFLCGRRVSAVPWHTSQLPGFA